MKPVKYSSKKAPEDYCCSNCGASGVKLWRQYQTFLDHIKLFCAACACESQGKENLVDSDGMRPSDLGNGMKTDQIGWLVPAVPTEDGENYWGYTSVPKAGVKWWKSLSVGGK
jgi:hypothetical protein